MQMQKKHNKSYKSITVSAKNICITLQAKKLQAKHADSTTNYRENLPTTQTADYINNVFFPCAKKHTHTHKKKHNISLSTTAYVENLSAA